MNHIMEIIASVFIITGSCVAVTCLIVIIVRMINGRKYLPAIAEIVGLQKRSENISSQFPVVTEAPVLRYSVDGRIIESACLRPALENSGVYKIGDVINIMYDPKKPEKHFVAKYPIRRHVDLIILIVLGLFFIGIGIYFRTVTI